MTRLTSLSLFVPCVFRLARAREGDPSHDIATWVSFRGRGWWRGVFDKSRVLAIHESQPHHRTLILSIFISSLIVSLHVIPYTMRRPISSSRLRATIHSSHCYFDQPVIHTTRITHHTAHAYSNMCSPLYDVCVCVCVLRVSFTRCRNSVEVITLPLLHPSECVPTIELSSEATGGKKDTIFNNFQHDRKRSTKQSHIRCTPAQISPNPGAWRGNSSARVVWHSFSILVYLFGLAPLYLLTQCLLPYALPSMVFLPLLLTSTYTAVGCVYGWRLCYIAIRHREQRIEDQAEEHNE